MSCRSGSTKETRYSLCSFWSFIAEHASKRSTCVKNCGRVCGLAGSNVGAVQSPLTGISGADGCIANGCVLSPGILLNVNSKGEVAPLGFGVGEGGVCVGCRVSKST